MLYFCPYTEFNYCLIFVLICQFSHYFQPYFLSCLQHTVPHCLQLLNIRNSPTKLPLAPPAQSPYNHLLINPLYYFYFLRFLYCQNDIYAIATMQKTHTHSSCKKFYKDTLFENKEQFVKSIFSDTNCKIFKFPFCFNQLSGTLCKIVIK